MLRHASGWESEGAKNRPGGASDGHELPTGGRVAALEAREPGVAALLGRAVVVARGDVEVAHSERGVDGLLHVLAAQPALRVDRRTPCPGQAVSLQLER